MKKMLAFIREAAISVGIASAVAVGLYIPLGLMMVGVHALINGCVQFTW